MLLALLRSVAVAAGCARRSLFSLIASVACSAEPSRRLVRASPLTNDVDAVRPLTGTVVVLDSDWARTGRPPRRRFVHRMYEILECTHMKTALATNKAVRLGGGGDYAPHTGLPAVSFPNPPPGVPPRATSSFSSLPPMRKVASR